MLPLSTAQSEFDRVLRLRSTSVICQETTVGWTFSRCGERGNILFHPDPYRGVQQLQRTEQFRIEDNAIDAAFGVAQTALRPRMNVIAPTSRPKYATDPNATVTAVGLKGEFDELARLWKAETRLGSMTRTITHPAYLGIIGLGPAVIPLILRDLNREPNHWFTALRALAKTSPVNAEDAGNMKKMRHAWLEWGKQNGYLD